MAYPWKGHGNWFRDGTPQIIDCCRRLFGDGPIVPVPGD